jgi:hypothetical protein
MISPALLALAMGPPLVLAIAEGVPVYDVAPGCRAAVTVVPGSFDACMKNEQAARTQLAASWDQFAAATRENCVQAEGVGGTPSYVELLTCLQISRDAQGLPKK